MTVVSAEISRRLRKYIVPFDVINLEFYVRVSRLYVYTHTPTPSYISLSRLTLPVYTSHLLPGVTDKRTDGRVGSLEITIRSTVGSTPARPVFIVGSVSRKRATFGPLFALGFKVQGAITIRELRVIDAAVQRRLSIQLFSQENQE